MHKPYIGILIAFMVMCTSAFGSINQTVSVTLVIQAINEISIVANSVTLTVNAAVAGSEPTQVSQSTTYAISTNCATNAKKLTAVINSAMPSGLTLSLNMTAPTGASSAGTKTITNVATDVVTSIDGVAQSGLNMTFYLNATTAAHTVSAAAKTLTLTLVDT